MQRAVWLYNFAQCAVDPKAHAGMAFVRFNVNIAGAVPCSLRQKRIEHADDRRVVGRFQQVFHCWQFLHDAPQVDIGLYLADDRSGTGFSGGIGSADALNQRTRLCTFKLKSRAMRGVLAHYLSHCTQVRTGVVPQCQFLPVVFQQQGVAAGEGVWERIAHDDLSARDFWLRRQRPHNRWLVSGWQTARRGRHAGQPHFRQNRGFIDRHNSAGARLSQLLG